MDRELATFSKRFSGISAQDNILAVQEAKAWIEAVTGDKLPHDDFRRSLESGVILCEFMEKLRPNSITKINRRASAIAHLDNIRQFLQACRTNFKLRGDQLFEITDLQDFAQKPPAPEGIRRESERRLRNVCVTLYWLGRTMSNKVDYVGPQLCLEAFENMVSGEDVFNSNDNYEGVQEVTVHMTTNNGGFGFQIVGGHDCSVPATVDRVVVGGSAESRGLKPNDIIKSLNGQDVTQLSHLELIRLIKQSGSQGSIVLGLLRRASFREFSPSSDGNYPSSGNSPLPNKTQSPIPPQNDRRPSEEHVAKSELLVNTARKPNKVYVGDSSGEDSDNAIRKEEWSGSSLKNNQEEEERIKKLQNDQELRRKQEEEMAQIYPAKYPWANGGNEKETNVHINETTVFDTYGGNLDSPLIRAHVDYSSHLQIEREMKSVSKATPRLRQKWHNEESRVVNLSPVSSRKHSRDDTVAEKEGTASTSEDDKAALEEQLKQLQLEAQLAREEAEALKREKAEDEARIRHEEQVKYQEELKRQSMDAQKLLAELQQQQMELNKKQQSLMQAQSSFTDVDKERAEIRQQLEEQRKAIIDQWQQLDQERQLIEEKRHLMRLEEEQRKQLERQKEMQQQELERLLAEKERKEQELQEQQEQYQQQQQQLKQEESTRLHKRDSWKMLSEVTQLPPEIEQRREMERQAEMKRQMERLQKKEKHKSSSSNTSYNQVSPSASWSAQNNASAMGTSTVHVTKPVQSSTHSHEFCSSCAIPLGTERAMSITSLGLLYHLKCFVCCVCHAPLATGLERTHVHVRNSRPHCKFCYSTETGLLATEC